MVELLHEHALADLGLGLEGAGFLLDGVGGNRVLSVDLPVAAAHGVRTSQLIHN